MSMDTLIIGLCLVAAVAFIAHKAYRAIKGTGGCSCGCQCSKATPRTLTGQDACRGCNASPKR